MESGQLISPTKPAQDQSFFLWLFDFHSGAESSETLSTQSNQQQKNSNVSPTSIRTRSKSKVGPSSPAQSQGFFCC